MGLLDTVKKLGASAIDLLNATALAANEQANKKMKKMSNDELLSLADKQPSNKYVKEERSKRGI